MVKTPLSSDCLFSMLVAAAYLIPGADAEIVHTRALIDFSDKEHFSFSFYFFCFLFILCLFIGSIIAAVNKISERLNELRKELKEFQVIRKQYEELNAIRLVRMRRQQSRHLGNSNSEAAAADIQ